MVKLAALLPLLLLSCAAITPPAAPPAEGRPILGTERELAPLLAQNRCTSHAQMTGHVILTVDGKPLAARVALLVSRPSRLRLTLADMMGSTWFLATADEERLFYASPSQGARETFPRRAGAPIRLGGEQYWAEDFVDNLPPCLDPVLLGEGKATYSDQTLRQERDGVKRRWDFYPGGRIKSLSLLRAAAPPVRFEFAYGEEGAGFSVTVNRAAEFHFTRVTEVDAPPASAFRPPEEK